MSLRLGGPRRARSPTSVVGRLLRGAAATLAPPLRRPRRTIATTGIGASAATGHSAPRAASTVA
eukprot:6572226-Lingulodinium_polyedra.AAC.1